MALVGGFSHLVVQGTDLDRSEKFYQEVLGLNPIGRDLVTEEGPKSLLRLNSGQMVLLVQVPKMEPFRLVDLLQRSWGKLIQLSTARS